MYYVLSCTQSKQIKITVLQQKIHSHSFELASFIASTIHTQPEVSCCNGMQLPGRFADCIKNAERQSKPQLCQEVRSHTSHPQETPQGLPGGLACREFETHRVTRGHPQPEVLTSETRSCLTTGTAQQWNGSRSGRSNRASGTTRHFLFLMGTTSCFLEGAMYLMCFPQMTDLFLFSCRRYWEADWPQSKHGEEEVYATKNSLGICHGPQRIYDASWQYSVCLSQVCYWVFLQQHYELSAKGLKEAGFNKKQCHRR